MRDIFLKTLFFSFLPALLLCACQNKAQAQNFKKTAYASSTETASPLESKADDARSATPVKAGTEEPAIEIKEKMFIAQTNDVYLNSEEYIGKKVKLEGLFKKEEYNGRSYCFVLRYGPGCCGNDGNAGFEIAWDSGGSGYPKEDDWVEAAGVFKNYEEDGYPYLYISLSSLNVLAKRGKEFVTQ
ncbi:MAG: hypothetical protein LBC53_09110 [Spirochaetaceae bacterium]|jgi:uncharacterized membrane protein YcgQ (UPF0703/DUF1980 family)|nr:hypothetical protein [Spirochaetaceae bacterium]